MSASREQHHRLTGYLVARMLGDPVIVVGADAEDTAQALQQTLRIAAERDLPLELVAPDRFLPLARVQTHGVSQHLADIAICTVAAQSKVDDPVTGPLLAAPGAERWAYRGLGWFTRGSGRSGALAGAAGVV